MAFWLLRLFAGLCGFWRLWLFASSAFPVPVRAFWLLHPFIGFLDLASRISRRGTGNAEDAKSQSQKATKRRINQQEAEKPRSREAKKPRSQEAKKLRSRKAKKPKSQEAQKPKATKIKKKDKSPKSSGIRVCVCVCVMDPNTIWVLSPLASTGHVLLQYLARSPRWTWSAP